MQSLYDSQCYDVLNKRKGVVILVTSIFEAKNLTKKYGDSYALENVSMEICAGEIYGLVGENGAGKTTLMRIIGNLVHPNSGSISLFGETESQKLKERRKHIGFLIETPALYSDLSAKDNLEFYCRLFDITNKAVIERVLHDVNLEDTGNKKVADFSLGMRQRLALAITLINEPEFLVLDEPINGLDPSGITGIREILTRLTKEKRIAVLISSHYLSELQLLATRFGFIHKGCMLQEITSHELTNSEEKQINIQTSNPNVAATLLREAFHVPVIIQDESGEIQVPYEQVTIEEVMSVLINNNIQILNVCISSPSLENYYMKLIKGEV